MRTALGTASLLRCFTVHDIRAARSIACGNFHILPIASCAHLANRRERTHVTEAPKVLLGQPGGENNRKKDVSNSKGRDAEESDVGCK